MENASKALLMAGGVLIAMLILSMAVILFNGYGSLGKTYEEALSESEVKSFNQNFIKFEGRTDITIQEIVSLVNFAKDYKERTDIEVEIKLGGINLMNKSAEYIISKIKGSEEKYECTSIKNDGPFGTVSKINFRIKQ